MVTKFPPKFFRKQVSPWRETYERIRQGPVFPRHTAARNMRSTKKSNTFLYRYSTFLHTTLTTIHGTVSHLNETIKIEHFLFLIAAFVLLSSNGSSILRDAEVYRMLRQKRNAFLVKNFQFFTIFSRNENRCWRKKERKLTFVQFLLRSSQVTITCFHRLN